MNRISCSVWALLLSNIALSQVNSTSSDGLLTNQKYLIFGPSFLSVRGNESYMKWGVPKIGFSAGAGITQSVMERVQIQGKLLYEKKGYKTSKPDKYDTIVGRLINNYKFDYLTLSVIPNFLLNKRKSISIGIGFYFGLLIKSRWQIIYTPLHLNNTGITGTPKDDYGLTLSIRHSMVFKKRILVDLSLTENYGLRQLAPPPPFPKEKNNSIVLMVAIGRKR